MKNNLYLFRACISICLTSGSSGQRAWDSRFVHSTEMFWLLFLILGILFNNAQSQKACGDYRDCSTCAAASDCTGSRCTWCASSSTCVPYLLNLCPLNARVDVAYNCPRPIPDGIENNYNDNFVRRNLTNLLCAANEGNGNATQEVLKRLYPGIIVPNYYSVNCLGDNSINILGFGKNSSVSFEVLRRIGVVFSIMRMNCEPFTVSL